MEFIEHLESGLATVVAIAELVLEMLSVVCVMAGLLKTMELAYRLRHRYRNRDIFPFNQVRLRFGVWLALALECQLGADILATTVAPTLTALAKLATIAMIRTFLNYFLNKEIGVELALEHRSYERELELSQESDRSNHEH